MDHATRDSLDYDPEEDTYRACYDSDSTSPSMAVVSALAEIVGTRPTRHNPLYEVVEPEALDELCGKPSEEHDGANPTVQFVYLDHMVRIQSYGTIEIRPLPDDAEAEDRA